MTPEFDELRSYTGPLGFDPESKGRWPSPGRGATPNLIPDILIVVICKDMVGLI